MSWQYLQQLHLDANLLSGTLPATWGSGGAMGNIRNITLAYNNLTGSVPSSWAIDPNTGKPHFQNLQAVTLLPQYGSEGPPVTCYFLVSCCQGQLITLQVPCYPTISRLLKSTLGVPV